jgi:plastocyanin
VDRGRPPAGRRLRRVAACAAGALAVAGLGAGGAEAATKTVVAGPPVEQRPAGFPADADTNQFYPRVVTVHAGDRVRWDMRGFHTVMFPAAGGRPAELLAQDPANPVAGAADPAGSPFWFNGRPAVTFNPLAFIPAGGASYTGTQPAASGAPGGPGGFKPYTLSFPKPGTYRYFCTIHAGNAPMSGVVKVVPRGRPIPSARKDRATVAKEFARTVARLGKDDRHQGPAGDAVDLGHDTAGTSLLRYFPAVKTVRAGATVTFAMAARTNEIHTVTFGPPEYVESLAFRPLDPGAAPGAAPAAPTLLSPIASYPSDPPDAGHATHTGAQHGNGFLNTGLLDREPTSAPPASARVTFATPGTYSYLCLVHPAMKGQIVVTP